MPLALGGSSEYRPVRIVNDLVDDNDIRFESRRGHVLRGVPDTLRWFVLEVDRIEWSNRGVQELRG